MLVDLLLKTKKGNKNLKKQDKACCQDDMAYGDYKDLARRRASDTVLYDHAFNIAKIQNMMDINVGLFQWFINFLIKVFWRCCNMCVVREINKCKINLLLSKITN